MIGPAVAGVGVLTGWGAGVDALPRDARRAAGERSVIPVLPPPPGGERLRRATRDCLLAIAVVRALARDAGLDPGALGGGETALLHVTAAAYGPSNRIFIDAGAGVAGAGVAPALHFPYTAPSALAGEVAIEFGVKGPYVILIGGAAATIDALWYAGRLLERGEAARALVLAVETFAECGDLYGRARWLTARPLVEAAACALLVPGAAAPGVREAAAPSTWERRARQRAGETFACEPLIALAMARAAGDGAGALTGAWRGRRAGLEAAPARPTPGRG